MVAILTVAAAGLAVFGLLVLIHLCVDQRRLFGREDDIGSQGGTNIEVPRSRGCPRLMSEDEINGLQCFDFKMEEEEERDENSTSGGGGGGGGGGGDGMVTAECTVCLEIYKEGEKCRVLPKCGHIFHAVCVDKWLRRNRGDCPLCRTVILE
ncbi:hypothetical protein LguiA_003825 [Lonicera macranthoides]